MTNQECLARLQPSALAKFMYCPNDYESDGVYVRKVKCTLREDHSCEPCITRWLESECSIYEKEEDDVKE